MADVTIDDIHSIDLVLEPVESVTVYRSEVVDIKLEFENTLIVSGDRITRKIKSGYLRLAIDDKVERFDNVNIRDMKGKDIKKPYKSKIEQRLIERCDICYLITRRPDNYWSEQLFTSFEMDDDFTMLAGPNARIDENGHLLITFDS